MAMINLAVKLNSPKPVCVIIELENYSFYVSAFK